MEPPPITLIKNKLGTKPEKDCVNIKLRINSTSDKYDMYEFIMSFFNNA